MKAYKVPQYQEDRFPVKERHAFPRSLAQRYFISKGKLETKLDIRYSNILP